MSDTRRLFPLARPSALRVLRTPQHRRSNSMSRISCGSFAPDAHLHLDSRSEPVENRHKAVYSESVEVGIADAGEVGGSDPGPRIRLTHGQALAVEGLDDFGGEDGLELVRIRVFAAEITKHIAGTPHYVHGFFALHFSISCRRFSRSFTRSISRLGVLIPVVDFF